MNIRKVCIHEVSDLLLNLVYKPFWKQFQFTEEIFGDADHCWLGDVFVYGTVIPMFDWNGPGDFAQSLRKPCGLIVFAF
jgi:hypothetical protein